MKAKREKNTQGSAICILYTTHHSTGNISLKKKKKAYSNHSIRAIIHLSCLHGCMENNGIEKVLCFL